jgi:hypothetical protein
MGGDGMKRSLVCLALVGLVGCDFRRTNCVEKTGFSNIPGILEQHVWYADNGNVNEKCGTVQHFSSETHWEAYAYNDESTVYNFPTRAAAEKWIADNWCKP